MGEYFEPPTSSARGTVTSSGANSKLVYSSAQTSTAMHAPPVTSTAMHAPPVTAPDNAELSEDLQSAIDFSDIGITEEQRADMLRTTEMGQQVQSVNERYDAAKRKVAEYKLKPGVYDNKQRRRLVEALLRRPACGRRVRSWRTENSDTLRGDVIPKNASSWGLMRMGRNNPTVDLHPGALGALSGMEGQWLSEENIPDNTFSDLV